jgi:hypothetical protein
MNEIKKIEIIKVKRDLFHTVCIGSVAFMVCGAYVDCIHVCSADVCVCKRI